MKEQIISMLSEIDENSLVVEVIYKILIKHLNKQ